jgi:putative Holliday junction resolvase
MGAGFILSFMRFLGLDFGTKRMGVAICEEDSWVPNLAGTIRRKGGTRDVESVARLAQEHHAQEIVIGLPLNMDGTEGRMARLARQFADLVQKRLNCPVHLFDERLSSWEACDLMKSAGLKFKKRKQLIDQVAASQILEAFMRHKIAGENKNTGEQ